MSADAIRIVADFYDDLWEPERTIVADDLHRFMYRLADQFQVNPETQPASPNVRECLETTARFLELQAAESHPKWMHHDTAQRLATEARAALAEPETGIVGELVDLCESSRNILAAIINGMHPDDPACVELQRRLDAVIAKSKATTTNKKGQTHE